MMFEPGIVVRHLNDDPQDFSKDNIALGTAKDNTHDIPPEVRARTARIASEAARNKKCRTGAKLNESDVREIRARLALGESVKSIAKSYGVGGRCIRYIRAKRTWADVA
jgi:hypothetical protein